MYHQITLSKFRVVRCLLPVPKGTDPQPRGRLVQINTADGPYLLQESLITRARSYSAPRLLRGGQIMLSCYGTDRVSFASSGFDTTWETHFGGNLGQLDELYASAEGSADAGAVNRQLYLGLDDQAQQTVRRIVNLASAAGLRTFLGRAVLDLNSYEGRLAALRHLGGKLRHPALRARISALGVTDPELKLMDDLYGQLETVQKQRLADKAQGSADTEPVQAGKALILGDILMVCRVARAELSKERARVYRFGKLLATPGRPRAKAAAPTAATPAGATATTHTATPTAATMATATTGHATATGATLTGTTGATTGTHFTATGAPTFTATGTPTITATGAIPTFTATGAATGTTGATPTFPTTGTATGATGATPTFSTTGNPAGTTTATAPAGVTLPAAGTVLTTLPSSNGPAVCGVLQPDGSVRWLPVTAFAPPEATAPQATTATTAAQPAAPTRRRRTEVH